MKYIIFADDFEDVGFLAAEIFKEQGNEVLTAENGKEALDLYNMYRGNIKAIVTDLEMPLMNGEELIRAVREVDKKTPIYLITALETDSEKVKRTISWGVTECLQKPISFLSLGEKIKKEVSL